MNLLRREAKFGNTKLLWYRWCTIDVACSSVADPWHFGTFIPFEGTLTSFYKDKVIKKSQNSRNQGFCYYLCLMLEGSPDPYLWLKDPDPDPEGPKHIRIRIRNTGLQFMYVGGNREGEPGRAEGRHTGRDVRPGPSTHHEDLRAEGQACSHHQGTEVYSLLSSRYRSKLALIVKVQT